MADDKPQYPSDQAEKFIVRFPPGMRERIAEAAKTNGRSMNAEVIARLQTTFGEPVTPANQETALLEAELDSREQRLDMWATRLELARTRLEYSNMLAQVAANNLAKGRGDPNIPRQDLDALIAQFAKASDERTMREHDVVLFKGELDAEVSRVASVRKKLRAAQEDAAEPKP